MQEHPEMAGSPCQEFLKGLQDASVVPRKCKNCGADVVINAAYAKYVPGDVESCRFCR